MHIRQLCYFIAVAEQLNFTEAAKRLYVSQPALSQQIADLEKQLNVKLFARDHHSVQLTPAGVVFLQEANEIVAKSEEAVLKVRQRDSSSISGNVTIGYLGQGEKRILSDLVRLLRQNCPLMKIKLSPLSIGQLFQDLKKGTVDIGFGLCFRSQQLPGLMYETLLSAGISVLMRMDHPLAAKIKIKLSDVAREPFITIKRGECSEAFKQMFELCRNEGFSPNIVNEEIDHIDSLLLMVEAGQGVTILSSHIDISSYPTLRLIPIEDDKARTDLVVVWRRNNSNPSIPLLLEELRVILKTYDFK